MRVGDGVDGLLDLGGGVDALGLIPMFQLGRGLEQRHREHRRRQIGGVPGGRLCVLPALGRFLRFPPGQPLYQAVLKELVRQPVPYQVPHALFQELGSEGEQRGDPLVDRRADQGHDQVGEDQADRHVQDR